ncbi:nucleoside triphosphate pyrophosphohydrolase [Paenibacillus sp. 1001270B_150601_E10]|uniref:nucleoside triphosphate pyrophosphohydrolase n=1 Tax=Paenibacillus sp. 1001270B_150601_E10 TaxID=2787079 RepID=UPI001E404110|nr:nucleoside triphosphate pyrophosphohydrolase [Paenibacillus sp. 1001270B_150601_E10]
MSNGHKVVRDRIPAILDEQGLKYEIKTLSDEDYLEGLIRKLDEEVNEYKADRTIEELADILEVVQSIARISGVSKAELEELREKKAAANGGFTKNLYLERIGD